MLAKGRKVTILIVPDHEGVPHTFKLSILAIRIGLAFLALITILFVTVLFTWMGLFHKSQLVDNLQQENNIFREEFQRVTELESRLRQLQQFEGQIRQALGASLALSNEDTVYPHLVFSQTDTFPRVVDRNLRVEGSSAASVLTVSSRSAPTEIYKGAEIPSMWPVDGFISRGYSWNPIIPGTSHPGVDIAGKEGAVVKAVAGAIVAWTGWSARYGNVVVLTHSSGYLSIYGHNQVTLVAPRQEVERGTPIALLGNTGISSAPHLHLEIWYKDQPVNPLDLLSAY